ncbi:phosphate uptake regulator PhoU [Candidatus Woesearchaeota archaeon]|nr:phosphate uptake regulator PhoU [Candidatus Woesearchaeota archaeon]
MEQRKLMEFGKSSFIISLPKKWVRENNLKKGDSLALKENSGELVVSAAMKESEPVQRKIVIDTRGKSLAMISSEIVSSYLNGYDFIELLSADIETRLSEIKEVIRNLSGLEIMEQTSTKMVAKDILSPKEVDIPSIIRRMDTIVRSMIDDSIRCVAESDGQIRSKLITNIRQRDEDINRLYFLSNRVIRNALKDPSFARAMNMDPWKLHTAASIILRLEKIGDRQKRVAKLSLDYECKPKCKKELVEIYADLREKYHDVMKSYYTSNISTAFSVEVSNKARIERCNDFLKSCTNSSAVRIVENLNGMTTSIKYISRAVIGLQD